MPIVFSAMGAMAVLMYLVILGSSKNENRSQNDKEQAEWLDNLKSSRS